MRSAVLWLPRVTAMHSAEVVSKLQRDHVSTAGVNICWVMAQPLPHACCSRLPFDSIIMNSGGSAARTPACLDFACDDIGDEGARSLAGLLGQSSVLSRLDFGRNDIGAEGARSLA